MISLSQFAKRVGVSRGCATRWVQQGILTERAVKKKDNGRYEVNVRIANWDLKKNLDQGRKIKAKPAKKISEDKKAPAKKKKLESFADARTRKEIALAEKHEFELNVLRGDYVPAMEVKRAWTSHVSAAKTKLLGIGPELTPLIREIVEDAEIATTIIQSISDKVESILYELAKSEI